jgi:hypothetical protein
MGTGVGRVGNVGYFEILICIKVKLKLERFWLILPTLHTLLSPSPVFQNVGLFQAYITGLVKQCQKCDAKVIVLGPMIGQGGTKRIAGESIQVGVHSYSARIEEAK